MNYKITDMSDEETAKHLLKWCESPANSPFSWPTDAYGYKQHIKFVKYKNSHWQGNGLFVDFVKQYAKILKRKKDNAS